MKIQKRDIRELSTKKETGEKNAGNVFNAQPPLPSITPESFGTAGTSVIIYDIAFKSYTVILLNDRPVNVRYEQDYLQAELVSNRMMSKSDVYKISCAMKLVINGEAVEMTQNVSFAAKDGQTHRFNARILKASGVDSPNEQIVIILNDINKQLETDEALRERASRDFLTGLYNRDAFFAKASEMIVAHEPGYYILAGFDIDNFKVINDQYGSEKGNELLRFIADNFRNCLNSVDGICGRIMSDKFAALFPAEFLDSKELIETRNTVSNPPFLNRSITYRIGRFIVDDVTLPISAMYDRATIAENSVKGKYDVNTATYTEKMREQLLRDQEIINEMNVALSNGEFEAWFQPQYNHSTGSLIGAEALVRWRHPKKGLLIPPGDFIPLFERNGFIYEMDKYIWEQACVLLRKWLDEEKDVVPISVNISRFDALRGDIFEVISGLIVRYDIPIELLRLEITESAFAESPEHIIDIVQRFVDYGFTVEIDDFGSGYSSLNTLKDVPANIIKLDMRFLGNNGKTDRGGSILESVVRMAQWLGMPVIAEGVETNVQADFLKSIGCDYVQGYLYAKPMTSSEYEKLLVASVKEHKMKALETVEALDTNAFWNPESMDTLIFNSYVGGACIFEYSNGKTEIVRANAKYAEDLSEDGNISVSEAMEISWASHMSKENVIEVYAALEYAAESGREVTCELILNGLKHCKHTVYLRAVMRVIASSGERYLFYCRNENITAQRVAEQKQREVSGQLRAIVGNINGGVSVVKIGENGTVGIVFANEYYYNMFGYTKSQFADEVPDVFACIHPDDLSRMKASVSLLMQEGGSDAFIYRYQKRNGEYITVRCEAVCTGIEGIGENVLLSVLSDITELLEADIKAEAASQRLKAIMDSMSSGITVAEISEGNAELIFVNDRYFELLGYTRESFAEEVNDPFGVISPEDVGYVLEAVERVDKTGKTEEIEFRCTRRDGEQIWLKDVVSLAEFAGMDKPVQLSLFTDITEAKQYEKKLEETDLQLRFLNDLSKELLTQTDENGINSILKKIMTYFDGDRAYIFEFDNEKKLSYNTYELCAEGVRSEKDNLQNVPFDVMSFWLNTFDKHNYINIENVKALGESRSEEREVLASQNINSLVAVPLRTEKGLVGFMGVDNPRQQQAHFGNLEALGGYLAVVLARRDLNASVQSDNRILTDMMDSMPGGFVRLKVNPDGYVRPDYINRGFCIIAGLSHDEVQKKLEEDLKWGIHPDDLDMVRENVAAMRSSGEAVSFKFRFLRSSGEYIWLRVFANMSKNSLGEDFINAYYSEVSGENNIQEQRISLLENLPCGAAMYELDGETLSALYFNKRYKELVDRDIGDLNGLSVIDSVHPDDRVRLRDALHTSIAQGRDVTCELRVLRGSGDYILFRIVGTVVGYKDGKTVLYATYMPIDEKELSYREMLTVALSAIMESSTDMSFVKDVNFAYISASRTIAQEAGCSDPKELIGKTDYDLMDKKLADKYRSVDAEIIRSGRPHLNYIEKLPNKDGTVRYANTSKYPLRDSTGNIIGIYGISWDVTKSRESHERLKLLTDSIPGGLSSYECSEEKIKLIYVNEGFCSLIGYTPEEFGRLSDEDPFCLIFVEDVPIIQKQLDRLIKDNTPLSHTYRIHTRNGGYKWIEMRGICSARNEETAVVNVVQLDITERREAEEKLSVSEKAMKLAMSKIGKTVCEYDIATHTLIVPEDYAARYGLPTVLTDMPEKVKNSELIEEPIKDIIRDFYTSMLSGKGTGAADYTMKQTDGKLCWEHAEFSTIFDSEGEPIKAVIAIEDTTRQHLIDVQNEAIKENERVLQMATSHSDRIIYRYDIAKKTAYADPEAAKKFGFLFADTNVPESVIARGDVLPESVDDYRQMFEDIQNGKASGSTKIHVASNGAKPRWLDMKYSLLYSSDHIPKSAVISFLDITQNHEKELAYERYKQNIEQNTEKDSGVIFMVADLTENMTEEQGGNLLPMGLPVTGQSRNDTIEYIIKKYIDDEDAVRCRKFFSREHLITDYTDGVRKLEEEWKLLPNDKNVRWISTEIQMVQDPYSEHIKAYTVMKDISEKMLDMLEVRKKAETDGMTGILNRATAVAQIKKRLSNEGGEPFALLVIDLDNLKGINDNLGHIQGDAAICAISSALTTQFRKTDIVGRIGGDEFIAYLESCSSEAMVRSIMATFMKKLSSVRIGVNGDVPLHASVGIALGKTGKVSYDTVFKKADTALYHVKRNGKNNFAIFKDAMSESDYSYEKNEEKNTWNVHYFDNDELTYLLNAVSTIYPLVISVNLTKNSYYMLQYENYQTTACFDTGTFDEMIEEAQQTFHPDDRQSFVEAFGREKLLAAHERGEKVVTHVGRQLGDDGVYRHMRTDVIFVESNTGDDVLEISLAREVIDIPED